MNENIERVSVQKNKRSALKERPTRKRKNSDIQISRMLQTNFDAIQPGAVSQEQPKDFSLKELSRKHILRCISTIFHLTQQSQDKNNLFAEDAQAIFMQVTCVRVPKVPHRQMRMLLPHSIVLPNDEVALFVCDSQRGRRKDYEPTVEYYRNLLNKHECSRVNEIIPMNRIKTEFDQFELKRKLVASYDHFLVDGRIAGHVSHLLGKEFIKKRKLPTSIRMQSKDLKHEIDYALRKTSMHLHSYGDTHVMQIGNTFMRKKNILENILAACDDLSKNYPGGWVNIRSIRLKNATSLGLPIYMTLKNKNTVEPPVVLPKRPKAYHDVKGELSTLTTNSKITVKPDGDVIIEKSTRKKRPKKNTSVSKD